MLYPFFMLLFVIYYYVMKNLFTAILIFILPLVSLYSNVDLIQPLFEKSIDYYNSGNIERSLDIYEKFIHSGINSGIIYYNIGNIYMDRHEYAKSILYYEKSLRLLGYDKDLLNNISLAYQSVGNDEAYTKSNIKYFHIFNTVYIISMFLILISSMLFFVGIVFRIFKILFFKKNILILLLLIFCLSCTIHFYSKSVVFQDYIIVQNNNAYVRDGKIENAKNIYVLKFGEKLLIEEKHENWYYVRLPFGNYGWVRHEDAKSIL